MCLKGLTRGKRDGMTSVSYSEETSLSRRLRGSVSLTFLFQSYNRIFRLGRWTLEDRDCGRGLGGREGVRWTG